MTYNLLIKNAVIPLMKDNDVAKVDIVVADGKIAGFLACGAPVDANEIIDAEGNLVIPGCIDSHTHFMDPGFTHRETFHTGTSQAAAGGVTTIIDMPCCSSPRSVRDVSSLNEKLEAVAPQAIVDYAMWGGVTGEDVREGRLENVKAQADVGVVAFKVYMTPSVPTYNRVTDPEMHEVFKVVEKTGLAVGVHAENFAMCDYYVNKYKAQGRLDGPAWSEARLELAEKAAIQLGIAFSEETECRFHVVHMSTGVGARLVAEAKRRGLAVTAEVCPHYLVLNAPDAMTTYGAMAKIAPPLRTKQDNKELWEGLANGSIDFVATDHAPYKVQANKDLDPVPVEKDAPGMNIWTAFPGIPGTETMVNILVSEGYNKERLTLQRLVEVLSRNAAVHYGLFPKKGAMSVGADADFAIIDLNKRWAIDKDISFMKNKYTPLHGMELTGKVVKTVLRGQLVYEEKAQETKGTIMVKPGFGQFVRRQSIQQLANQITFANYRAISSDLFDNVHRKNVNNVIS
ncbi:dihydroorotase [Brenneria izadpanahii]|uniref:Dihydroorotase n=1 Tax=Brenneria izadpanahii TaxID=2722756 RepID=A0ABX7USP1_9GAMM|nr:dihydroorotase [Brenneria izadpanahii]QTF08604.1 dihydroorotase [Brenneria izadpanahii]